LGRLHVCLDFYLPSWRELDPRGWDAVSGRERMQKLVTCACDDPFDIGAHAFRVSVEETRHVHRDQDGML
jgi:hypothetical protein